MDLHHVAEALGGELASFKRVSGLANETYRVDVRRDDGVRRYAVKVYLGRDAKLKASRELAFYAAAPSYGLGAPRVVLEDLEGRLLGRPILAWEWIEGEKCEDCLRKTISIAKLMGAGLAHLHEIPCSRVGVEAPSGNFWERELESIRLLQRLIGLRAHLVSAKQLEAAEVTLIHGDYNPGNLLVSGGRLYVLDGESIAAGDPLYDVAYAFIFLYASSPRAAEAFAREYFALTGRDAHGLGERVRLVALKLYCVVSAPAVRGYLHLKLGIAYPLAELLFLSRFRKLLVNLSFSGADIAGRLV